MFANTLSSLLSIYEFRPCPRVGQLLQSFAYRKSDIHGASNESFIPTTIACGWRTSCVRIRGCSRLVLVVRKLCCFNDTQTLFCRAAMLPDKSACSRKATPPLHLPPPPASHSRMMHPRTHLPLLFPVRPFSIRFPKRPRALPSMAIQSKARPKARINGNLVKETS